MKSDLLVEIYLSRNHSRKCVEFIKVNYNNTFLGKETEYIHEY